MTVRNQTIDIDQGAEVTISATVTDGSDAVDISSGYTFQFVLRDGGVNVIDITTAGRFAVSGASNNVVSLTLTEAETGAITVGTANRKLPFQLWVTDSGADSAYKAAEGVATVYPGYVS